MNVLPTGYTPFIRDAPLHIELIEKRQFARLRRMGCSYWDPNYVRKDGKLGAWMYYNDDWTMEKWSGTPVHPEGPQKVVTPKPPSPKPVQGKLF